MLCALFLGKQFPKFRKIVVHSCLRSNSPRRLSGTAWSEDDGTTVHQNVGKSLLSDAMWHHIDLNLEQHLFDTLKSHK